MAGGRRGHGEGSIHKRADGRWAAVLDLGYQGGKRKRKYFYGATRREVQEQLTAALRAQQQGLPTVGEKQTVAQYLKSWLEIARPTVRPGTWRRYEEITRRHIVPTLGRMPLARLSPQQVQQLYAAKLSEGLSATTVHHIHRTLRRALGEALRLGIVARNIATLVKPPRPTRPAMRVLTSDQARALLDAAKDDRLAALYVLALSTGMRQGELLGLRWHDVDLERGSLQVRATLQKVRGQGLIFAEPKTSASRRKITLSPTTISALRQHRARQLAERMERGPDWQDYDLVFPDPLGLPMDGIHLLRYEFVPLLKRARLPAVRFHDLRHTAATLLLQQGVHPKVVQEMLGHATISITLDTYSHVLPNMHRDASMALEQVLWG